MSGTIIGRYVVLSTLGAGAMGVVLAAYDPELDRKVALKLLAPQPGPQEAASARLKREAQALAKLEHPNVVSVYDVGVHEGQIFVGMEFVDGSMLSEWMAEPRPWREVVRVFSAAGRGLAAAHEAGLVHRDFKPDNVMIGADGRVRVMDFGLARASHGDELELDPMLATTRSSSGDSLPGLTQTGALMGTPAYMALERYEGVEADVCSDQFSFCVALYEALHGVRPFAGNSLPELLESLETGRLAELPKGTKVPAWLRKVVVRGLASSREARWPSMHALLDALADDPALRRRRWWARALAAGIIVGVASMTWTVRERDARACRDMDTHLDGVWDAQRRADVRAAIEGTQLSYAKDTWLQVEQRLDAYTQQWVAARVDSCEATRNGEQSGELLDLRMACLDERLAHVRATVDVLEQADATIVEKAVAAVTQLPSIERCSDVEALRAEQAPPDDPDAARRVAWFDEQLIEIQALERAGKYDPALTQLVALLPEIDVLDHAPLRARAWLRRGALESAAGDYEIGVTSLERAYELAVAQRMTSEAAEAAQRLMFVFGNNLGQPETGRSWARHSGALALATGTDEAWTAHLNSLGIVASSEGKHEEARGYHEQTLAIRERRFGPDHLDVAHSLNNLGIVAENQGRYDEARRHHERALAIREKILGPEHLHVAYSLANLGNVVGRQGHDEDSRVHQERALSIKERALGLDHPDVAVSLTNLGVVADRQKRYDEAIRHYERALAIWTKAFGPEHPHVAHALCNLGIVETKQGRYDEARVHLERALAIKEAALGPEHPDGAVILLNLGDVARGQGRYEDALGLYERGQAILERAHGKDHLFLVFPLLGIGRTLLEQGQAAEALAPLELALQQATRAEASETLLADAHFALARASWDAPPESGGDPERARALVRLARDGYSRVGLSSAIAEVDAWLATHE